MQNVGLGSPKDMINNVLGMDMHMEDVKDIPVDYQGKEFTAHIQANTESTIDKMIEGMRQYAAKNDLDKVEVLYKSADQDGGWEAVVKSHNWNPISWMKEKLSGDSLSPEEEAERVAKEEEAAYNKAMEEERQQELAAERAEKIRVKKEELAAEFQEKEAMRQQKEAEMRARKEMAESLPKEMRKSELDKIKYEELSERLTARKQQLSQEYGVAALHEKTKKAEEELKKFEREGYMPEESLISGFSGEYRKVMRLIRAGRARPEDLWALREMVAEAKNYSVDVDLLNEITKLRRKIENQDVMRKIKGVVESIPKMGSKVLKIAGGVGREFESRSPVGRVTPSTRSVAPVSAASVLRATPSPFGLSSVAASILRVNTGASSRPIVSVDNPQNFVRTRAGSMGSIRMPSLKQMLGV